MKKTTILIAIMLVISLIVLSSCGGEKPCTEHTDTNTDYICDNCGATLEKPAPTPCTHKDENGDHKCDACQEKLSECADSNNDHKCDTCDAVLSQCADGNNDHKCDACDAVLSQCADADKNHKCDVCDAALSACADADSNHACDVCGAEMGDHVAQEGTHNCAYCGQPASECQDADGDYLCDICGVENLPANLERVSYDLNISDLEVTTLDNDAVHGLFTITSGTTIRARTKTFEGVEYQKSVKIGAKANMIKVSVPGTGTLSFLVQNGSSGAVTQFITVTGPDGMVQDIEFAGTNEGSPVLKITVDVTEGEWIISRGKNGGTQDIFALSLSCIVEKAEENGFALVTEGIVDYLCGQQLDFSELRLNATFANGKTEPLSIDSVNVDASQVNLGVAGTYPLTITYKNYDPIIVNIHVYLPTTVVLGTDVTVQEGQSSFGNGLYINHSLREVYAVGETLDLDGLSVVVSGTLGDATKNFNVGSNYTYTCDAFDTAGSKTLTVSYVYGTERVSATINLHVVDTAPSIVEDVYQVKVDASYTGVVGAVEDGYNMFTTVQQALDFLADSDVSKRKVMIIEEGLYTEKLEITIPNLHIKGVGADQVVIEWNSIYGIKDAGGFSQVTDSTQTVAVRDSAYGVTIEGVTISNYWNSQERMDEAGLGIERGLALLVQADRFIMRDSKLLGIQDTLELFTGRQYFENVFISGYTDFVFGTNNTTLFKNCTIHVIDTVKDDQGTAGYITAFKGSNKGAADAITYGAIFYQCSFTADEGVAEGKTAIGRTWGAYAAVAIIDSEIGGHISTDGYDSSNNKNKRYISMNGIHPTDSTVQFVEYGNTGAGAVAEAVAGMRMLTAEEAALYIDIATIFGKNNRTVSWLDAWNPEVTEIVTDDRTYYHFDQGTGEGNSNTFDITTSIASGSTLEWAGILISAENGKVAWNQNANALNMKQGAFIRFTVPAGTEVTVVTYPSYNFFTMNGVATSSANMLTQYYAEETEVIILSTGDLYLYRIIINPGEEAPEAATLTEIKVSGMNVNYVLGDEVSMEGAVVKAYYSDGSIRIVTDYTVNTDAVDSAAEGEYAVVFTYGDKSATVTVTYEDPNAAPEIVKDTYLDFSTTEGFEAVQNNPKVTMDGSFRMNGAEYQVKGTISFPVKAGTFVRVIPYSNSAYASYTLGREGEADLAVMNTEYGRLFLEDCVVVYTGLDNNYLVGIEIICPIADGKYVFGGSTEEGDVTGILASVPGIAIEGICKTHSGGAQLGADSCISFVAPAYVTVTIKGFDTNYGQLAVEVDGELIAMDSSACYVFSTTAATSVTIRAINVGTEDAPAYNKSYITYMTVVSKTFLDESTTINFGSEGNYKEIEGLNISGIEIRDNGGNNSQIKNGSLSFSVKAGAVVTVHGYPSYTSYAVNGGATITDEYYSYTATEDGEIVITPMDGNNYFYSISVVYPVVIDESTTINFGSEGNYKEVEGLNISSIEIRDNGGNNSQIKNGSLSFSVKAGATVTVNGYPSYTSYTFGDGNTTTAEITESEYVYTATEDVEITITPVSGNNYFYSIVITY